MAKTKEGDLYTCGECGMIVAVDDPCGCSTCDLICCDVPMTKGILAARKAKKEKAATKGKAAPRKAKATAGSKAARK